MKTIQFKELTGIAFDIHNIVIMEQHWTSGEEYAIPVGGRPDNGIMFLHRCEFKYFSPNGIEIDRAARDSLVYSPIGSKYSCICEVMDGIPQGSAVDYLINFRLFEEKTGEEFRLADDRMIIAPENKKYYLELFEQLMSLRGRGAMLIPRIKAQIYELLCRISLELQKSDLMNKRFAPLYPAIKYLRVTDIAELDVSSLASLCHLSESCFRRLFTEYFGKPPMRYINEMKTAQAEERLRSGLMTVAEVAESLGFSDYAYFSRFYKRQTGRSPSEELG